MDVSNYDYNGVIFIFGRVDSSVTSYWKDVTRVELSVDSTSNFVYSSDIKEIPYTQQKNFDGTDCKNNVGCKIFNINTFTHRKDSSTAYQFGSGTHTCRLRFYYNSTYTTVSVTVRVHSSLTKPTVTLDAEKGIVNVKRTSSTSYSPRHYIEIRRKDRNLINPSIPWEDKDYIHTVVMKGIEGGKFNEGVPHTGFMERYGADIAGSAVVRENRAVEEPQAFSLVRSVAAASTDSNNPTPLTCDVDMLYTSNVRNCYYVFTAPKQATYLFTQTEGVDLECSLYSDKYYSNELASQDDGGGRYDGTPFELVYNLAAGQTVYVNIYDYSRNGKSVNLQITTVDSQFELTSFTPYTIEPNHVQFVTFNNPSTSYRYATIYPARKAKGLSIPTAYTKGGKTPYYTLRVAPGENKYAIRNNSLSPITYWITEATANLDYQPYWRVNPISQFRAVVVFDDERIYETYKEYCMAQVEDALTRLTGILSETSGNSSVTFDVTDGGVRKHYVKETLASTTQSGRYVNSSGKVVNNSSGNLYYIQVKKGTIYRVSYGHGALYYSADVETSSYTTTISASKSNQMWYETTYGTKVDENTLVVWDDATSLYVSSNEPFTLEQVRDSNLSSTYYTDEFGTDYNIIVRFGVDGTTWMGDQGIATSGGYSADINGEGQWIIDMHYDSADGIYNSMAIINVDNSDYIETLNHVIHEEIAQSLGIGDDCYSREESIHWDPEYANPDYYVGIDKAILAFVYNSNKNGYTQFDLCNEYDLPITLFKDYGNYNSSVGAYQFHLKDASGKWLLRPGEYEVYAWCVGEGGSWSSGDGWDNDPYSLRTAPVTFTVEEDGWYWLDYDINMKDGSKTLKVSDVHHTIWNAFIDVVAEVMGDGYIPDDSTHYGSAATLPFAEAIEKAKLTNTEDGRVLYAQRFNIVNYIINSKVETGIGIKESLVSQVLAEDLEQLQDCRNLM